MNKPDAIKICGLSTTASVDAVIDGGATHMGLIFFGKSPRNVTVTEAAELSSHAGDRINKVAVTVNADDQELDEIIANVNPDMLQLHGSETIERVRGVRQKYGLPVIKAVAVREPGDLNDARQYIGIADMFLFDAKAPQGSDRPGGNGVAFDWTIMDQWPENVPYMLSGGLNVANIRDALSQSGATAIDVSSGVEKSPGKKDESLITEFLAVVA